MGESLDSAKKKKTRFPTFYQSFDFDATMSPDPEFMPLVTFRLFDIDGDPNTVYTKEYLGTNMIY